MSLRIFIENPPPFRRMRRRIDSETHRIVDGSMEEGLEAIRFYLNSDLQLAGFHHSDIDPYESRKLRGDVPLERFNTFEYAKFLKSLSPDFQGLLIPHRVGVYQPPGDQAPAFAALAGRGIRDVVVVGKPSSAPRAGVTYHASVEDVLAFLAARHDEFGFTLGAIGIHLRHDEPERIVSKYRAAGGRLRLMGQFLDEADKVVEFLGRVAEAFNAEGLSLDGLEYNVGLAIFALKNRGFYAQLLRKEALDCEARFQGLKTRKERIAESVRMNMEFGEQILEAGRRHGVDVGFSVQPLIERTSDGSLHPAVHAAADLAKKLERLSGDVNHSVKRSIR